MNSRALVIWQLTDGKRGHERQSAGLIAALARRRALDVHRVDVSAGRLAYALEFLTARFPHANGLPDPDFLIGAGRACQLALLAARRARGGRAVYLMRPALPWRCFDLCIVPRHDRPPLSSRILISEGPLNPLQPARVRDATLGLILLGGPSAHHGWDTRQVVQQIERIVGSEPALRWTITDSRRSPADLAVAIERLVGDKVTYRRAAQTDVDWLPDILARAAQAWVSADSMAMLYEALTGGARVGLIEVPVRRHDRIAGVAADLIARGWVAPAGAQLPARAPVVLAEAERCAEVLLERWPEVRGDLRCPDA